MNLSNCHNFKDFQKLAKRKLPSPIFNYIDGAADDEITYSRNTSAYNDVDLIPNILRGVEDIDLSTEIFGKKLSLPIYCAPTAVQRLFHYEGEKAVAKAASKFETLFGVSSLSTVSVEEIAKISSAPKMFQFYFHKDRGLNDELLERAKKANFDVLALTVDTITGGNRERDLRTGFTIPPKLTIQSMIEFGIKPAWFFNHITASKFELPHLKNYVKEGTNTVTSIGQYFSTMLDQDMNWKDAEKLNQKWGGHFALKGIMSVEDAKKAIDIGCSAIIISNHGGRQLDGSRAPFDQLAEIVDAVGDKIDVVCEGGIQRGTHILKALSLGAKACSGGRMYLYALAAAGQAGVERALNLIKLELERDMKLMGCTRISQLSRENLRFRSIR
ncbi:MAG: alpha-hydroxy-acid oxidizing enzyme [Rhodobacteraceae bacterium]|nr:alpha-hydroxy-acid oxidizing enzyme [Paracoccaceae bacterium]